jgi:hypothetical protein
VLLHNAPVYFCGLRGAHICNRPKAIYIFRDGTVWITGTSGISL